MTMLPVRGGIYPYQGIRRGHFLVLSLNALNRAGTTVVVEVTSDEPASDLRSLLAVRLSDDDPMPGSWALCWHLNYLRADRLEVEASAGQVTAATLDRVVGAVHAVIEP